MLAVYLLSLSLLTVRPDSLAPADTTRPVRFHIRPAFNLDFRDSFLEKQHVNVWGINAGIEFGPRRHQLTIGYYWINYATYLHLIDWRRDAARRINLNYYTRTDLWFVSTQYWWNLINNKRWMVSFPAELGGGVAYALPLNLTQNNPIDRTRKSFFVPLQVGGYAQWKASRWAGLTAQVGYRISIFQTDIDQNFNGSYYSIGISIYPALLTDIWRWVKTGDKISPLHPPQPQSSDKK
ncbi:hypothetical protein [Spirosoma pollinicola]|uniref:DUF3575 domain-containing protein n=1 Tax=Spirosoma pollinicola TaxID=2057025 RepID=A0A2K8YVE0_9BACT|nr:hypothetical protein [Spirosoma pollinicola]AUD01576.1 hypothetical protein CWM47_06950 [Spirosoma pollinicola]